MRSLRLTCFTVLLAALALAGAGVARAEDDDPLQRRALALNNVTGEDPIKGEVKALIEDAANTKKLLATAVRLAKGKDQPFNYNACYILARAAHGLKDLETSRTFYRLCIGLAEKLISGDKLAKSYSGLIDLLTEHKKHDEVAKVCEEFLALPEDDRAMQPVQRLKSLVLRRMITSLAGAGQTDKAMKLVDRLLDAQPDEWRLFDLRADVQYEAGQYAEAAKTYEDLLKRTAKDKELTDDEKAELRQRYRYLLSSLYVDLNDIDKATKQLRALLAEKPDHPTYNNDLGYILADHDQSLDEAEKLIRKALDEDRKQRKADPELQKDEDRDNAAYLDSMGWVLFKKKKFEEAKKYLLQAVEEKDGQHVEILDHLADVHLALGEKDQAKAVWKKALEVEAQGKREKQRRAEVEKKLKANQ